MNRVNILRKYNDVVRANNLRQKSPIPKLPKSAKKLNELAVKHFEVLQESKPVSEWGGEYHPGGVAITDLLLKCPFCGMEFSGTRRSGCFMNQVFPLACPNCNFPNNVFKALDELWKKKREKK